MSASYAEFLASKAQLGSEYGFSPSWVPDFLFPFQRALVEWAVRKGRGALFADCGLGKTPMQLVWAENVVRETNRSVLILTPLAVAQQTVREAQKFGLSFSALGRRSVLAVAEDSMLRIPRLEIKPNLIAPPG